MHESEIVKLLQDANEKYRAGDPIMEDSEYDSLVDKLPTNHWYKNKIEEEELQGETFIHPARMRSTQKAKTDLEVEKWIDNIINEALQYAIYGVLIRTTAKLDGMAANYYDSGELVTRGNGEKGNIVTSAFAKGVINTTDSYGLGELVMEKQYFDDNLKGEFSHPRNVVVGIVMSDTVNPLLQKALDSNVVHFAHYENIFSMTTTIEEFRKNYRTIEDIVRNNTPYPIDGVVIEVVNHEMKQLLGSNDHHNKWQIALKPKDIPDISKVIDIKWSTGRTGRVTPVIIIEPVEIDGAIIRKCTGHNARKLIDMEIEIGCNISIIRSGGVIPYCERRVFDESK